MSSQHYTPEFKDEAVRQITQRGHSVSEVSARLGVSAHSLYKWVRAFSSSRPIGTALRRIHNSENGVRRGS